MLLSNFTPGDFLHDAKEHFWKELKRTPEDLSNLVNGLKNDISDHPYLTAAIIGVPTALAVGYGVHALRKKTEDQ